MSVGNFERSDTRSSWVRDLARFGSVLSVFAMLAFFAGCTPAQPTACTSDADCDFCDESCDTGTSLCADASSPCGADETCDESTDTCIACTDDVDCDDADACTTDTCSSGTCSNTAVVCDTSDLCNPESCDSAGDCVAAATCAADQSCDPADGSCTDTCADATECDDADACNGAETCGADGLCAAGSAVTCDDSDLCTDDACVSADGTCTFTPKTCGADETCEAATGNCVVDTSCTVDGDCDDSDLCTTDTCPALVCVFTPVVCADDGLFCTGVESCDAATGTCTASGDPCTSPDTCDETSSSCTISTPGVDVVLTTGTDTTSSLGLTGGDDIIRGAIETSTTSTFDLGDDFDGGAGNDELRILFALATPFTYTTNNTVAGVEDLFVKNFAADDGKFSLAGFTGLNTAWSDSSLKAVEFDNISTLLGFGLLNTDQNLTAVFKNAALSATDDSLTVSLSEVDFTVSSTDVLTAPSVGISSDGSNGVETVTVDSGGTAANAISSITATDTGSTDDNNKLMVTGGQAVRIGAIGDQVATIDASGNTASVDINTAAADAKNLTVTLTGGDDTIRMSNSGINDTVDCGDGNDLLIGTYATTGIKRGTFTGCESAKFAFNANATFRASEAPALTAIELTTSSGAPILSHLADGTSVTVSKTITGATAINFVSAAKAAATMTVGGTADITMAGTTFDEVLTIAISTSGTKDTTLGGVVCDNAVSTALTIDNTSGSLCGTGNITGTAKLEQGTFTSGTANLTVGTLADCSLLTDLTYSADDSTCTMGAVGAGTAALKLENLTATGTNRGVFVLGATDATAAGVSAMSFATAEDSGTGTNTVAVITAATIGSVDCNIADDSDLTFADFIVATAQGLASFTCAGKGNLIVTSVNASTDIVDFNAATMTGNITLGLGNSANDVASSITTGSGTNVVTMNTAATGGVTYTGGSGNDTYIGTAGVNTVVLGNGTNVVTAAAGANVITLGSGADTVKFTVVAGIDSITGFSTTNDTLNVLTASYALEDAGGDDVYTGANEYVEIASAAGACGAGSFNTANDVIVLTSAAGFTTAEVNTCIDQGVAAGDALVIFYDSATSLVSMLYDADIDVSGGQVHTATFSDIAAADIAASFAAGDFVSE